MLKSLEKKKKQANKQINKQRNEQQKKWWQFGLHKKGMCVSVC